MCKNSRKLVFFRIHINNINACDEKYKFTTMFWKFYQNLARMQAIDMKKINGKITRAKKPKIIFTAWYVKKGYNLWCAYKNFSFLWSKCGVFDTVCAPRFFSPNTEQTSTSQMEQLPEFFFSENQTVLLNIKKIRIIFLKSKCKHSFIQE